MGFKMLDNKVDLQIYMGSCHIKPKVIEISKEEEKEMYSIFEVLKYKI